MVLASHGPEWICAFANFAAYLMLSAAVTSLPAMLNSGGGRRNQEALTATGHQNIRQRCKPVLRRLCCSLPQSLKEHQKTALWNAKLPLLPTITGLHWAQTFRYTSDVLGVVCESSSGLVSPEPGSRCTSGQSESSYHVCRCWQNSSDRQVLTGIPVEPFTGGSPLDSSAARTCAPLHFHGSSVPSRASRTPIGSI